MPWESWSSSRPGRRATGSRPRRPGAEVGLGPVRPPRRAGRGGRRGVPTALESRPQDFWSNFYHGLCAFRLRKFNDSAADFQAGIALSSESAVCHFNRAMAYAALGRTEEASAGYSKALGLDPELAAARLNRGIHSYKFGRNADAVVDFEAALNSDPDRETRGRLHFILTLAQLA